MNKELHLPLSTQESIFLLKFAKEAVDMVIDKDTPVASKREIQNAFYATIALDFCKLKELKDLKSLEDAMEG